MNDNPEDYWSNIPAEEGGWWGSNDDIQMSLIPDKPICNCANPNLPDDFDRLDCPLHSVIPGLKVRGIDGKPTEGVIKSVNYVHKSATVERGNLLTVVHIYTIELVGNGLDRAVRRLPK